eukprot:365783-Chlamydomonas_euryale.AAC.23
MHGGWWLGAALLSAAWVMPACMLVGNLGAALLSTCVLPCQHAWWLVAGGCAAENACVMPACMVVGGRGLRC